MIESMVQRVRDPPTTLTDVPMVELAARTRYQEARAAMAVAAALRAEGVALRDIAIVARDLDQYEEPLAREAIRHELTPAIWTQLRLHRTRPYQLVTAVCELFATWEPTRAELFAPLMLGWTPESSSYEWPITAETLTTLIEDKPRHPRPVIAWKSILQEAAETDPRVGEYLTWVAEKPAPKPETAGAVLRAVLSSYRETVLPIQRTTDSPALLETETAARAVIKLDTLLGQVERKYERRLEAGRAEESWMTVAGLCESLAKQRPGRREHANARALDILETNDIWARKIPYIIVVGVVDHHWPQRPWSILPTEIRHAMHSNEGSASSLAPRTAWIGGRDRDQVLDVLHAATTGVIFTHYSIDSDGVPTTRSPFLDPLDVEQIGDAALQELLSAERRLPAPIRAMLQASQLDASEVHPDD